MKNVPCVMVTNKTLLIPDWLVNHSQRTRVFAARLLLGPVKAASRRSISNSFDICFLDADAPQTHRRTSHIYIYIYAVAGVYNRSCVPYSRGYTSD